jgi:hypothetical protein
MASIVFTPKKSPTDSKLYGARYSNRGDGLPRKQQFNGKQMTEIYKGTPRDWPFGVDIRAPQLPGGK